MVFTSDLQDPSLPAPDTLTCLQPPSPSPFAGLSHTKEMGGRGGGGGGRRGRKAQRAGSCGEGKGKGVDGGNRGSKGGPCGSRGLGGGEKPERQKGKTGAGKQDGENWWVGRVQG